ncbi:MAG: acyl-CoA thioesterase/bile acid-CoA:amino acid N-acyltransferase family protein [Bryobacteraceae bacterium]
MKPILSIAACLCFGAAFPLRGQALQVDPSRVMMDQPATIRASGLQPDERVTIRAELVDGADARWTSQADFIADAQGSIDTSRQAPIAGSYKEVSAMGLVWSMMPHSGKEGHYQPPKKFAPQTIEFQLVRKGEQLATARLEQLAIAEGVERIPVHDGDLRGVLFLPPGNARHPGVLALGGSEGGYPARRGAWLASHGYAAFALAYFHYEDLPRLLAGIPLEYFGKALSWMARRPEILADRVAVMGGSRGGELALQLGSMYPRIGAVVAYVPSNVRNQACCGFTPVPYPWTWEGKPLAFRPARGRAGELLPEAAIAVENTQGPVLLISGEADGVWPSSSMADSVVDRLQRHHFAYSVEHLKYPHAGHGAGRPEIVPAWVGTSKQPVSGQERNPGGSPKGNAESSLDAIPKVLEFLQKNLPRQ